jgi:hypothetical protein
MILRQIEEKAPRSRFYLALLFLKQWDYAQAVRELEFYLSEIPEDYHKLVVQVNLAAAYIITGQKHEAREFLASLYPELKSRGHSLLYGNCLEIESHIHFLDGEYESALDLLEKAEKLLADAKNMGWLYARKWTLINRMFHSDSRDPRPFERELAEVKGLASEMGSWETLREVDLYRGLFEKNEGLVNHVYFGSPHPTYKAHVSKLASGMNIASTYAWTSPGEGEPRLHDLNSAIVDRPAESFLVKKLLLTLVSDFYAGFRIGHLFSTLFEGEYFDPQSSPDRVFQLIHRLRGWMKDENWRCKIESERGQYRLRFSPGHGLILRRDLNEDPVRERAGVFELFLRGSFAGQPFTANEVGQRLACSTRSANRRLRELLDEGRVERLGSGKFTRFKLAS